jgi:hypothetical protein
MVIMSDAAVRERQPADFVNVALERLVEALLELHGSPPRTAGVTECLPVVAASIMGQPTLQRARIREAQCSCRPDGDSPDARAAACRFAWVVSLSNGFAGE